MRCECELGNRMQILANLKSDVLLWSAKVVGVDEIC